MGGKRRRVGLAGQVWRRNRNKNDNNNANRAPTGLEWPLLRVSFSLRPPATRGRARRLEILLEKAAGGDCVRRFECGDELRAGRMNTNERRWWRAALCCALFAAALWG